MLDNNLKLWLPFNDPDGNVAYDYSVGRHNAGLSDGATLERISTGKALSLNGEGEALSDQAIPFTSDFTVYVALQPSQPLLGWLLNFSGMDKYLEQWLDVTPGKSVTLVFVRNGRDFSVYKDGNLVYNSTISENPVGLSVNDPNTIGCYAKIDEFRMYNVAKSLAEILKMGSRSDDVEYYVNGINIKDFGVYVSDARGLAGRLARKEALTVDWETYHGIVRDRKRPRFKERNIELECFIEASSRFMYIEQLNRFFSLFDADGTQRLKVDYAGMEKPLVYEVVCNDEADPNKKWGRYNDQTMVGTFVLKLVEDEPVKKVLRHIGEANSTSTITLTSTKMLNIYWGDGDHSYNVSGTNQTITHTYTDAGEYEIIIAGVIEDITAFSTNEIVIWDNLH